MSISQLLEVLKTDITSMSIGEKLLGGCATALLAMVVVFAILVLISGLINVINATPVNKPSQEKKVEPAVHVFDEDVTAINDMELVSVITASIMATSSKNIVVKRIKRSNNTQSNWENVSYMDI